MMCNKRSLAKNSSIIISKLFIADTFISRLRGLLGKKILYSDEALAIIPCSSVHMFFMRFSIDVVFLNKNGIVIKLIKKLKPWRMAGCRKASWVVELPMGAIEKHNILKGDKITIE